MQYILITPAVLLSLMQLQFMCVYQGFSGLKFCGCVLTELRGFSIGILCISLKLLKFSHFAFSRSGLSLGKL